MFSVSFTNSIGTRGEDLRLDAVAEEEQTGPRQWCEKDDDPDEDSWWTSKEVIIESFIDQPRETAGVCAHHHVDAEVSLPVSSTTMASAAPAPTIVDIQKDLMDSGMLMQQDATVQIQNQYPDPLFPARLTISEEELASVTLDPIVMDDDDETNNEDFELVWDQEEEDEQTTIDAYTSENEEDMDIDEIDAPHSDVSTPAPSTPITETPNFFASATPMHDFGNRCMLPAVAAPHQGSPSSSMGGAPSTPRSVARVRGFAVRNSRTELVL